MESGKSHLEHSQSAAPKAAEGAKRETHAETVADFLSEKYGLKLVPNGRDIPGVVMNLAKGGCEIEVDFYSYTKISDIHVKTGEHALIQEIVTDLENNFDFIDQNEGTVNRGHIRVHYNNPAE